MIVRLERPDDRDASLAVERAAFENDEEPAIVVAVREEEGSFALVAEDDGRIVGHVQLSRAWLGDRPVLALGPIGVEPDRQGQGIGGALIEAAAAEARARGETALILLGSQAYYPRFGFEPAARYGLRNPFTGVRDDGFEIREEDFQILFVAEGVRDLGGDVRWHPAFGSPSAG